MMIPEEDMIFASGENVERKILEFFNSVNSPYEIRDRIKDDPNFGSSFRHGVTLSTAERILKERNETPSGQFTNIEQVDAVHGVGPSTLHNILYTFQIGSVEDSKLTFIVSIEGILQEPFLEIDGLESITEIVKYDGGDDLVRRKRPGRTSFSNIILRRRYIENTNNIALWNWRRSVIDGVIERKSGSIIISDNLNNEIARYSFSEAWPCRWKINLLYGANGHMIPIEEIELVVEKLECAQ